MDNAETNRGAQKSGPSWEFREARVWSRRRSIFVKGQKYGRNSDVEMCLCSQSPCSPFCNVLWESSTDGGPGRQAGWPTVPRLQLSDATFSYSGVPEAGDSLAVYKGRSQAKGTFIFFHHFSFITAVACPYLLMMELWGSDLKTGPRGHTGRAHSFFFFFFWKSCF